MEYRRIAIDTSKHVFTLHGVDDQERAVLRRDLRRAQVEPLFARLTPCEVVLEACGGSHHWARTGMAEVLVKSAEQQAGGRRSQG